MGESQTDYAKLKKSEGKKNTVWFYLHKNLKQANDIVSTDRNPMSGCLGEGKMV